MVKRERLKVGGLRAYELGRLRAAVRAAWFLVPVATLCALETAARQPCLCISVLLTATAIYMRWQSRQGSVSARNGLLAGGIPLMAGLVLSRVAPSYAGAHFMSPCTLISLAFGVPSGVWLGLLAIREAAGAVNWLPAAAVSILAASLGCVGLGIAGIAGAAIGLLFGMVSTMVLARVTAS